DRPVDIDYIIQYKNSSAPQRTFDPPFTTFSNVTTDQTLYLLSSADGIYVTFQVINVAEQPIADVVVNASRVIAGSIEIVGQGITGADGGVTFWLNPDFLHTLTFVASGYEQYTTSLTPTQSSYTITLGGEAVVEISDYQRGMVYSIEPTFQLFNHTAYNFNFTLASAYWDVVLNVKLVSC
ncbi:unnamed protein product, partial [marine sediment metagenome]